MSQIKEYQVFKDEGRVEWENGKLRKGPSKEYQKIRAHLVFDVNHDGRHDAMLVGDGHHTKEPVDAAILSCLTQELKIGYFLAELNQLDLLGAGIGNAYLEPRPRRNSSSLQDVSLGSFTDTYL